VCTTVSGTGQHGFKPGERFADDPGEEARRRLVRLAWSHHHARQADADAVTKAAPGVVGEQRFADRLLRAVGGERREMKIVGDRRGKGRAEHRDRGGENEARTIAIADRANRFEQRARPVEIDPIALVEVDLGFAGDDAGEVEYRVGAARDRLGGLARRREIGGDGSRPLPWYFLAWRGEHVEQPHLLDRLTGERAVLAESLGELSADHAGRAGDQDMHFATPVLILRSANRLCPVQLAEAHLLLSVRIEILRREPELEGSLALGPFAIEHGVVGRVAAPAFHDHVLAHDALEHEAITQCRSPRRRVERVALPFVAAVAKRLECMAGKQELGLGSERRTLKGTANRGYCRPRSRAWRGGFPSMSRCRLLGRIDR